MQVCTLLGGQVVYSIYRAENSTFLQLVTMHVYLVSSQEAGRLCTNPRKEVSSLHAKCRFMCIRDIFSLREVHIYMRGGHSRKAKRDFEVNPCLLSSNKSRPHLSTYIIISEGQKGAVQLRERRWILSMVSRHEAFP